MESKASQIGFRAPPIFVVGPPRSGTTLVARILGRHCDIFSPGESHFFEDIWTRRKEIGKLTNRAELSLAVARLLTLFGRFDFPQTQHMVDTVVDDESLIDQAHSLGGGYSALYYAFMSRLAESAGKTRFCDDTPKHLFYLHAIFDFFPNAKVIGCARDPRDFLCSYKNYWKVTSAAESTRIEALYHPVLTSLLWRSSTNLLIKHTSQCCRERLHLVQYEKLVQDPAGEVDLICSFLGLDYSDELINLDTHNSSFENSSSGIFTTSVGRWRNSLDAEEIWCIQTLARENMLALEYETETVSPSKKALFRTFLIVPWAFMKALLVNTHKRGPVIGYVLRRLSTLVRR